MTVLCYYFGIISGFSELVIVDQGSRHSGSDSCLETYLLFLGLDSKKTKTKQNMAFPCLGGRVQATSLGKRKGTHLDMREL